MTSHTGAFGPGGWVPAPGTGDGTEPAWTKELLGSAGSGDSFALLRLPAGGASRLAGSAEDRILVLDGALSFPEADGEEPRLRRKGAYAALPPAGGADVTSAEGALALVLSGSRLGAPAEDVFGPRGWQSTGPGQWSRLLLDVVPDENFDERVLGLSHFEPGSFAPRHPHRTAHRFLFLDGEADDEWVLPDGSRHTARRAAGDFVDYPFPVEHQTFSRTGCTLLFVHEALPTGA
ncbi:hypothetical protein [Streptomyces griseoaurantiacus]|uniref:hypothetical protein n=1 Tax=Streptomyces griseoaurantiacus TaxID=68213 RepID=UPI003674DBB7